MPEKKTIDEARKAKHQGKSPSTQAGAFVHEEIEHIREGKHGARSAKQAIAIGLSKARRAGVPLPPAPKRRATRTRSSTPGGKRAVSHKALSDQAKAVAKKRTHAQRSASAKKAARTRARLQH